MIQTTGLCKTFRVHKKLPGFWGSLKSLVRRDWTIKTALANIDIKIEEGEIVGLVGANGAGKTTLVKILAGIIHPTSGEATVLGFKPWERDDAYLRQMALIMGQKAQLWWDLPAADSYELLREIYEIDVQQYKKTLQYLIETLGVQDQMNIQVRRLSLGERMKMELIASLLHSPKIVFLDEPTIGLDLTAQMAIRKFIDQYRKDHKPAMILTSHYMEDIEHLCERIIIIKEGAKVYDGPLESVVKNHVKDRVVTFVCEEGSDLQNASQMPFAKIPGVQVIEAQFPVLKVKAPTMSVSKVIQAVMQNIAIRDIDLSEEDIANIIESMIRKDARR